MCFLSFTAVIINWYNEIYEDVKSKKKLKWYSSDKGLNVFFFHLFQVNVNCVIPCDSVS